MKIEKMHSEINIQNLLLDMLLKKKENISNLLTEVEFSSITLQFFGFSSRHYSLKLFQNRIERV